MKQIYRAQNEQNNMSNINRMPAQSALADCKKVIGIESK